MYIEYKWYHLLLRFPIYSTFLCKINANAEENSKRFENQEKKRLSLFKSHQGLRPQTKNDEIFVYSEVLRKCNFAKYYAILLHYTLEIFNTR